MFKKVASIVAMLLVFLCGAQSMSVSAESVEEVFSNGKYTFTSNGEVSDRTFEISGEMTGSFITVKAEVVFKNVVITGDGVREKIIQTSGNGKLTLDGVTIKSGARSAKINENSKVRTIYANKEIYIKDLIIEDGVSEECDIENGSNPLTIEKTNVKSIVLGNGNIVVNQNTELENVIEISFKLDSELTEIGKTIVQGDKNFPASNVRNRFKLDESLKGEFSLGTSGNDLILVAYDPNLDVVEGEDDETPEGGDEDGSGSVDASGGENQGGNESGSNPSGSESETGGNSGNIGDASVDKGESGDGSDQGDQGGTGTEGKEENNENENQSGSSDNKEES